MEDKIKCVRSVDGTIIPIHSIARIADENLLHYVWTNREAVGETGYVLSDKSYRNLLEELEIIDGGFID